MLTKKQMRELPVGRHRLEPNLYLRVRSSGNCYYTFKYQFGGRRRELSLGNAKSITIALVREQVAKWRFLLSRGIDPKVDRERIRKRRAEAEKKQITLREFYDQILPDILRARQFHGEKSKLRFTHLPFKYIMPLIGDKAVSKITTEDIVDCLKPYWERIPTTAQYLCNVLELIFSYAKKQGLYTRENPAVYKHNLDMFLPPYRKIHETVHFRYADNDDFIHLMKVMAVWHWWVPHAVSPLYIMLTALLACRSNESCGLMWSEIDLVENTITLPKERKKFKTGEPFVMPLSRQAIWILQEIRKLNSLSTDLVFRRNDMSRLHEMNIRKIMAELPTSLHGMRSSFRNWCLRAGVSDAVAEISLMHAYGGDATVRSYLRDDLLDLRRDAMQQWADWILPMEVLTGEFLSEEQKNKIGALPYKIKGRGWKGLWEDYWDLGLRQAAPPIIPRSGAMVLPVPG